MVELAGPVNFDPRNESSFPAVARLERRIRSLLVSSHLPEDLRHDPLHPLKLVELIPSIANTRESWDGFSIPKNLFDSKLRKPGVHSLLPPEETVVPSALICDVEFFGKGFVHCELMRKDLLEVSAKAFLTDVGKLVKQSIHVFLSLPFVHRQWKVHKHHGPNQLHSVDQAFLGLSPCGQGEGQHSQQHQRHARAPDLQRWPIMAGRHSLWYRFLSV
mmetsp:Transcript_28882/g.68063  ORF Transcript_28882/g.68063 Transcript_28882/m.68063 type:complete len:217 (-) Transcript_28882:19-669(-)